jgi:hypothetical protein
MIWKQRYKSHRTNRLFTLQRSNNGQQLHSTICTKATLTDVLEKEGNEASDTDDLDIDAYQFSGAEFAP